MINTKGMPVQPRHCETCPFEGTGGRHLLRAENTIQYMTNIAGLKGQHLCHSADNTRVCRGGRNIQLRIACAIGVISEPTDEAFEAAIEAAENSTENSTELGEA